MARVNGATFLLEAVEEAGAQGICPAPGVVGPSGPTTLASAVLARQMARDPGSRADALRSNSPRLLADADRVGAAADEGVLR